MNETILSRPIPESYWVEPGYFLAGEYPGHPLINHTESRLIAFLQAGFDTFINLTQEGELEPYQPLLAKLSNEYYGKKIACLRFPIGDYGLPADVEMKIILNTIDAELQTGHKIYLHCWGGVGRTGTVVGCYLVHRGSTGEQALHLLENLWQAVPKQIHFPRSPETDAQVQFVLNWKD